jgi:hypothetical protein
MVLTFCSISSHTWLKFEEEIDFLILMDFRAYFIGFFGKLFYRLKYLQNNFKQVVAQTLSRPRRNKFFLSRSLSMHLTISNKNIFFPTRLLSTI